MAGVVKKIDEITPDLRSRLRRLQKLTPLLKRIGVFVSRSEVPRNFARQSSPDGEKWKPLSAQTKKARRGRHRRAKAVFEGTGVKTKRFSGKILQDTGRLKASITYEIRGNAVAVGTNVAYAARHQFGFQGVRGAKGGFARGKAPTPARPFLFDKNGNLSENGEKEIAALIEDYVETTEGFE